MRRRVGQSEVAYREEVEDLKATLNANYGGTRTLERTWSANGGLGQRQVFASPQPSLHSTTAKGRTEDISESVGVDERVARPEDGRGEVDGVEKRANIVEGEWACKTKSNGVA